MRLRKKGAAKRVEPQREAVKPATPTTPAVVQAPVVEPEKPSPTIATVKVEEKPPEKREGEGYPQVQFSERAPSAAEREFGVSGKWKEKEKQSANDGA